MPRVARAAAVRHAEILDCAARLFTTRGYDGTSVADIIAELGISKGAFYHHVASKECLLEQLAGRYAAEAAAAANDILNDESLDCYSRLNNFLARLRRNKLRQAAELNAAFAPLYRAENIRLYQRTLTAIMRVVQPILSRIIAEGVADKTFDTPDPDNAAEIILYLMGTTRDQVIAVYDAPTPLDRQRMTRELTAKLVYVGTVIDRILGLPEGSIEIADEASMAAIAATLRAA